MNIYNIYKRKPEIIYTKWSCGVECIVQWMRDLRVCHPAARGCRG